MKTLDEIQAMLDLTVNKLLGQHGGRVDVVSMETHPDNDTMRALHVKMSGGCRGCAGAKATLRSIVDSYVTQFDSSIMSVVDDTDHTDKTHAFFKEVDGENEADKEKD